MKRRLAVFVVVVVTLALAGVAGAETLRVSVGNYYYEDDRNGDRTKIVVRQGDQIAFTVRQGIYPPHTVEVDELNIHSGDLLLGETYTTPQLNRVGNFLLYCRPHRERGHVSRLIIQAPVTTTTAPPATEAPPAPGAATTDTPVATATPSPVVSTPTPTLVPVGVTKASPEELSRPVAVDPDSLEGLTGRVRSNQPWTRALWFLLIASVPIVAAAAAALGRELMRAAATGSSPSSSGPRRSSARSPRSSARKASGSGRTSRDRRR
ncbi:MAG: hypothetical protein ACRDKJ_03235 [Actinomycetota bacterium]